MLKFFLSVKYLRRRKIVLLSIAAVALSVSLLMVVGSLFTGFIDTFERNAVDTMGDIIILPANRFSDHNDLTAELEKLDSVKAATAMLSAPALLHLSKGDVRAVELWGIEPGKRAEVTNFKQSLLRQKDSAQPPCFTVPDNSRDHSNNTARTGCFVGIGVVTKPDKITDKYDFTAARAMTGKPVVVTTGSIVQISKPEQSDPNNPQNKQSNTTKFKRRTARLYIADIVFSGLYDLDTRIVYMPLKKLQKILYPNGNEKPVDKIFVKLTPGADTQLALTQIRALWQAFAGNKLGLSMYMIRQCQIQTAQQMQSRYIVEIKKQMSVLMVIFGIVSFSVVVLVFCIFYMIVKLVQKDIAIIKSCGTSNTTVLGIFLCFGLAVGVTGSVAGTAAGYLITKNINQIEQWVRIVFGLKLWQSSVYMFSRIPTEVDWSMLWPIVLSAITAVVLGVLAPALIAVRTKPVKILRYE